MSDLIPHVLERRFLPKVWGGTALRDVLGIELPPGEAIGETWELFDRPDGSSALRGSDRTLRDLMAADPRGLLGPGVEPARGGRFPLLIKFIDAHEALSVQVHPDDELAAADGDGGKSEAWVVLHAGDNARIIRGFEAGVTEQQVAAAAGSARIVELLHAFRPGIDDAISIPAGTVHSIGPDVVVFEVQQNSDLTYRLHDWGRPRELHVEKALRALDLDAGSAPRVAPEPIDDDTAVVVQSPRFRVRRVRVREHHGLPTEGSFKILTVLRGRGTLGWRSGGHHPALPLNRSDTALVPASIEMVYLSPIGDLEIFWTDPGGPRVGAA